MGGFRVFLRLGGVLARLGQLLALAGDRRHRAFRILRQGSLALQILGDLRQAGLDRLALLFGLALFFFEPVARHGEAVKRRRFGRFRLTQIGERACRLGLPCRGGGGQAGQLADPLGFAGKLRRAGLLRFARGAPADVQQQRLGAF